MAYATRSPVNRTTAITDIACMPCSYFAGTSRLQYGYWLGLRWDLDNNLWLWQDGDDAGNGALQNAYPYSHW